MRLLSWFGDLRLPIKFLLVAGFLSAGLLACLLQSADSLAGWAEAMVQQQAAPVGSIAVLQQVLDQAYRLQNGGLSESDDTGDRPPLPETPESAPAAKPTPSQQDAPSDVAFVRVPLPLLDELLRLVGEQHGLLAQLRAQNQQLKTLLQGHRRHYQQQLRLLAELEHSLANPQQHITDIDTDEFDSLEMQQFADWQSLLPQLYETVADSFQTEKAALALARQSHNSLADFSQWHQATLQTLLDSRLVAADSLAARWQRSVRQAERLSGKHAELHLLGADTLLDNQLLAQLADPLMHLLRNAIDHGLETPEQRLAAGKPEKGQITLSFHHEHHQLTVTCQDDGQGIDRVAVRHSAISKGLLGTAIVPDNLPHFPLPCGSEGTVLSDSEIDRLILLPSFSTRTTATELSGRGIGMDVVNQDISRLQGALDIHSQPGQGCRFTLTLPSSALLVKVLLVACGGETVALSGYGIHQVLMANTAETDRFRYGDSHYPLYRLENLWQKPLLPATKRARAGVMLMQLSADEQVAVQVTTIVGHREVVLKSLSPYLPTIPGLMGAITLSNGAVAPVLDLPALIRHQRLTGKLNPHALSTSAPKPPLILVVDDSLSARQTTADTLRDSGFQVITAVDGVDALKQLQHNRPDVLVTDLEMPRMNGLELAALLKNQADTENLPILMISSRSGDKHRQQALAVGIDAYLPKPWSEAELLRQVKILGLIDQKNSFS
jgi:chemosensory pili system protein ChpA (sensor histidine kinase/response regulator)